MTRSVDDLAADVRDGIWGSEPNKADAALSELVALVDTLTQERDEAMRAGQVMNDWMREEQKKRKAAESSLADMRRALEPFVPDIPALYEPEMRGQIGLKVTQDDLLRARRALAAAGPAHEEGQA